MTSSLRVPTQPFAAVVLLLAACTTPAATQPAAATTAQSATAIAAERVVGPPEVAWKDMTKEQRGRYMKAVVLPKMQALFAAHDPKEFAEIGCDTCHGVGAKDRGFKMPGPDLLKLPSTPAGWGALQKEKPEMLKFMGETVKPQMAALLGMPAFDFQKPEAGGFGCGGCHASE